METYVEWIAPTFVLSLTGLPVGSVPAEMAEKRMPSGPQVVGVRDGEKPPLALRSVTQRLRPLPLPIQPATTATPPFASVPG